MILRILLRLDEKLRACISFKATLVSSWGQFNLVSANPYPAICFHGIFRMPRAYFATRQMIEAAELVFCPYN